MRSLNPTLGFAMPSRTSNWMLALGAAIALVGLCIMPAALVKDSTDSNLLGLGATLFSIGTMFAALGIYLKARALQDASKPKPTDTANAGPIRGGCDRCQADAPV